MAEHFIDATIICHYLFRHECVNPINIVLFISDRAILRELTEHIF